MLGESDRQYQDSLQEKFQSQYDEYGDVWSTEAQMRGFVQFALRSLRGPRQGLRAVDLGAGRGYDTLYLLQQGLKVTALDLCRMSEWNSIEKHHGGTVEFIQCSLLDWETAGRQGSVSLVIDNGCYHHQAKSFQAPYLEKVNGLLALGGIFALNIFSGTGATAGSSVTLEDDRLVHIYNEQLVMSELQTHGFSVEQMLITPRPHSSFRFDYLYVNAVKISQ